MKHQPLDELEKAIGHGFADRKLLERALTHSSATAPGAEAGEDNERLEFLGDAVLQLVTSQELLQRFPASAEGELSRMRAHLVNATHLVHCATALQLGDYLRLGRGEEKTGGRRKSALLSDAVEAVLAALYLDAGMETAARFVVTHILEPELTRLSQCEGEVLLVADHKSALQQLLSATGRPEPRYELVGEEGPPHQRNFTMRVLVNGADGEIELASQGAGSTKKAACQKAAEAAIAFLRSVTHA